MVDKCAGCETLEADILGLNNRLQALEHTCARMREAFVKNDLDLPDYDGHRNAHNAMITQAAVVEGYKQDATKKVFGWVLASLAGMFLVGFFDWIKGHLK